LATCHERVERLLTLQARLQQHLLDKGCDEPARQAVVFSYEPDSNFRDLQRASPL